MRYLLQKRNYFSPIQRKNKNSLYQFILLYIFLLFFSLPCFAQEKSLPYIGIIHIHSNISQDAIYPLRRVVSLAKEKGIKILVFSDTYLRRWEYGLPILSNIFKVWIEERSVAKYGIKEYRKDIKKIQAEFPDMLILEGVEVAPFYWWSGNFFKKNLTLNDGNKHLLAVGLKNEKDYVHLPVVGNRYFLPRSKDTPFLLIPAGLIIWGMFLFKKRQKKFRGLALTGLGILFLLNIFPFSASRYNPYQGNKGFLPYQDLINYVNKKGGLVFWAHPEITELAYGAEFAGVSFYTPGYPESLLLTSDYAGFGVNMLPGTSHKLILAGEEWDKVLISYCEGKREEPVWAIGEADYRGRGRIDSIQNIFFLPEFKQEYAYEALRSGRLYVRYYSENNINISLQDFYTEDSQDASKKRAFMGDEVKIRGKPRLRIKGDYKINPAKELNIEIIRNGEIIKEFKFGNEGIFDLEFQDDSLQASFRKSYYRLNFFAGGKIILVTNPIFVEIKNE